MQILRAISFLFLVVGIILFSSGMIEVVYLKDTISFISQQWEGILGVVSLVIAGTLFKITNFNKSKQA